MSARTIVVAATPGEPGREALALGIELARPIGAQVVLVGVERKRGGPPPPAGRGLEALERELFALRDSGPHDVPLSVQAVTATSVLRGLHDEVLKLEAQMLILGPTHRRALVRMLRGDLAEEAVFTAPCAVAVAAPRQAPAAPHTIGVGWDGSEEAEEALEWAVQLAERTGAEIRIVRALDARHAEGTTPGQGIKEAAEEVRRAVEARAPAHVDLVWGDPAETLAEASRRLDLLVLGSRAQGLVQRTLHGSVSSEVLRHARCAVVVLPHGVHAPWDTAAV